MLFFKKCVRNNSSNEQKIKQEHVGRASGQKKIV